MAISTRLVLGIAIGAILLSLGFVALSYSVDSSHMTRFFRYSWMVIYFLFTMVVIFCAQMAFQFATDGWSPPSKVGRYSKIVANLAVSVLVIWLAFWYQSLFFLWILFVLALVVLLWMLLRNPSTTVSQATH